jgi:hypothetical protein
MVKISRVGHFLFGEDLRPGFIEQRLAAASTKGRVPLGSGCVDDLVEDPALIATVLARLKELALLLFYIPLAELARASFATKPASNTRLAAGIQFKQSHNIQVNPSPLQ